jgi:predicted ATPase/DNA-binding XRE family transcriptional regulator
MDNQITFGAWVKQQRKTVDLTQEAFAERVGCSSETIRKIEAGTARPSRQMAELVVAQLGVPKADQPAFVQWARDGVPPALTTDPMSAAAAPPAPVPRPAKGAALITPSPQMAVSPAFQTAPRTNLRFYPTPLVGREAEIATVSRLLRRSDVRLVTLTGPPGVGKTRLAVQTTARLLDDFAAGVWFVPLAPIRDPGLVASAITTVLRVTETAGRPPAEMLADYLRDKHLLLVLDNFEQVLDAGALVATLLAATARLKVLVTSRAVLRLYGEHEFPVPPLSVPDASRQWAVTRLVEYDAVELFRQRADASSPGFMLTEETGPPVSEICRRLDGLPLAIELAAARCKLFSPAALLVRLDRQLPVLTGGPLDQPARHQTLRAALAWSYDLLPPAEQRVLRRLAVFSGGWTAEAAAAVCAEAHETADQVLDRLEELVAQSLVVCRRRDETVRYGLLESIREYAWDQLVAADEAREARDRHLRYYAQLVVDIEPELFGAKHVTLHTRLGQEYNNLRAAVGWATGEGDSEEGLKLVGALWYYWNWAGFESEARSWASQLLAAAPAGPPGRVRAKALHAAGRLAWRCADFTEARARYAEALALFQALGDKAGIGLVLNGFGLIALDEEQDYKLAHRFFEDALAARRAAGDRWGIAHSLSGLAGPLLHKGDYSGARAVQEEALSISRELGDVLVIAWDSLMLGDPTLYSDRCELAQQRVEEGLAIFREVGNKRGIANGLLNLAFLARWQEDYDKAAALLEECLTGDESALDGRTRPGALLNLGRTARLQGHFERARQPLAEGLALAREENYAPAIVWGLGEQALLAQAEGDLRRAGVLWAEGLTLCHKAQLRQWLTWCLQGRAEVALLQGQVERAVRLQGAGQALLETAGDSGPPLFKAPAEQAAEAAVLAAARARLDEATWEAAWAAGQAMSLEQAVAYGLQEAG